MPVSRIGVVGCGLTGSGIVEVCARSGLDVNVAERGEEALAAGRSRVVTSLDRGLRSGKLSESERQGALDRLAFTTGTPNAARSRTPGYRPCCPGARWCRPRRGCGFRCR
ncbi:MULTISPECIES: 3-hydroxyacyl-CoA dehydrogenase NAD-binding domain-containing protein [unclassified Streptomyces]|uniref:3-hydroxyacyl-CoA dehydrogenase NAD-binding domain-containing protein n=1 Tax=unclassified Streptomyces TaxID=2593676 RepID=UPI002E12212C